MKNKNINIIRKKLDKIDIKLLKVIKERTLLVDQVLNLKESKKEVIDQKRINFILKRIKSYSKKLKVDLEVLSDRGSFSWRFVTPRDGSWRLVTARDGS